MSMNPLSNPLLFHPPPPPSFDPSPLHLQSHFPHLMRTISNETYQTNNTNCNNNHHTLQDLTLKTEQQQHQDFSLRPDIPAWLSTTSTTNSSLYSPVLDQPHHFIHESHQSPPPPPLLPPQPHISATALLQKAAQMGSTMSRPAPIHSQMAGHSNGNLVLPSSPVEKGFVSGSTASSHFLQMMNSLTQGTGFRENDGRIEEGGGGNGGGRKLHEFFII